MKNNLKKGFSLVELLIVLTIFATLTAVLIPLSLNILSKSKATQVAENIIQIRNCLIDKISLDGKIENNTVLTDLFRDVNNDYYVYYYIENGIFYGYIQYEKKDFNLERLKELLPEASYPEETIDLADKNAKEMKKNSVHTVAGKIFGLNDIYHSEFVKLLYSFKLNLY